jgi:hypothetical protein
LVHGDYWTAKQESEKEMSKFFTDIQKDEIDMMRNTKNYTMRTRLNREINYSEDFKKKYLT